MMKTLVGCPHSPVQEECDEILDSTWGRWEQLSILLVVRSTRIAVQAEKGTHTTCSER